MTTISSPSAPSHPPRRYVVAIATLLFIGAVAVATSFVVGWLSATGRLIPGAAPLGVGLVLALAWLSPRWQAGGWAFLTVWLLPLVYAVTKQPVEYIALAVVLGGTLLALWRSPWFLVGVWFFHPAWDLIPRTLPAQMHDLPVACIIYDLIVACYLAWAVSRGRIVALGRR